MTRELTDTIPRVVERAPQWIRGDPDAKDAVARIRATAYRDDRRRARLESRRQGLTAISRGA